MFSLTGFVLLGIVLTSGVGALVVCGLVMTFGYAPEVGEKPAAAVRRLALTRAAYGIATVCFAVSALLAIVALGRHSWEVAAPPAATSTLDTAATVEELRERQARLREEMTRMAARVNELEARARVAETRVQALEATGAPASSPRETTPPVLPPRSGEQSSLGAASPVVSAPPR